MQKNQIRTILIGVIFVLVVLIAAIVVKRALRAGEVSRVEPISEPRPDNAMVRIQRAGAVTAIERGDYKGAIETLSAIVKAGNGMGDEAELLRVAKDLEERYRKPSTPEPLEPVAGTKATGSDDDAPRPAEVPPSVTVRQPVTRPSAPATVRRPPPPPPARPVVVARVTPPEPATGVLLVTSVPTGLSVEVDGKRGEFTPLRKVLEIGAHQVIIYRRDEAVFRKTVIVPKDGVATVDADLSPESVSPPAPAPAPTPAAEPKSEPKVTAPVEAKPVASSSAPPPAVVLSSDVGEVLVLQAGLVGDVFIEGVGYGPPPVLAKSVRVGEVTVELRADGSVKRRKTVVVEKGRRASVQFR